MSIHELISNKITFLLDNFYYNNLKNLYNKKLCDIFQCYSFPIIKPDYFVFTQYYFIYLFFYNMTRNNIIKYTFSLHMIYVSGIVFENLAKIYNYNSKYNIIYLKDLSYLLFIYLLFFKILFLKIILFKKIITISILSTFYLLFNINDLYKYRLKSIETKENFRHPLQILVFSPNIKYIKNIINKTSFFTFTNFLLLTNIIIYAIN